MTKLTKEDYCIKYSKSELPEQTDYTEYVKSRLEYLQYYWQTYPQPGIFRLDANRAEQYGRKFRHIR